MYPIRPRIIECFINNKVRHIELKSFCGLLVKHCESQSIALSEMGVNQIKRIQKHLTNRYKKNLTITPELGKIYLTI